MKISPRNQFKPNTPPVYQKIAATVLASGIASGGVAIFSGHPAIGMGFQILGLVANFVCHWVGNDTKKR